MNIDYKENIKQLFVTPSGVPFAEIFQGERNEVHPIASEEVKHFINHAYMKKDQPILRGVDVERIKDELSAQAFYSKNTQDISVRIAKVDKGIEIDLNDSKGQCVSVDASDWAIKPTSSLFSRPISMKEMTTPQKGGHFDLFKKHFKTRTDEDLTLIIGFMLACLCPTGPYPILVIQGEQGTAKSTTCAMIKRLVDPSQGDGRGISRSEQDLFIAAENNHLLAFDNVSNIRNELSDALCRFSTGGTFTTRALYSNKTESMTSICKPVMLNGITNFIQRHDLASRSIIIQLDVISQEERKTQQDVWASFETDLPFMLGVLMNGVSSALRNLEHINLKSLPRMADFAKWGTAAEEGIGWESGQFLSAFTDNQSETVQELLGNDPLAIGIQEFMNKRDAMTWEGTATSLLNELEYHKPDHEQSRLWPNSASQFSRTLKRLAPSLRQSGINVVEGGRTGSQRVLILQKIETSAMARPNEEGKNHKVIEFPNKIGKVKSYSEKSRYSLNLDDLFEEDNGKITFDD